MVPITGAAPGAAAGPLGFSAQIPAASSENSFSQQLLSALEGYIQTSGNGSQFEINVQPVSGQNSVGGQYIVTVSGPASASASASPAADATPQASNSNAAGPSTPGSPASPGASDTTNYTVGDATLAVPSLSYYMQNLASSYAYLTPQQLGFQLANSTGTDGRDPGATVPGASMTFGDLTQSQLTAYIYAQTWGTGGLSMQDFLNQNLGPQTPWNLSYNQIQANPDIQASAAAAAQEASNAYTPHASSGNADNLPNPALIQYLPPEQRAAAEAAVAAEGPYGTNIAAAAEAYAMA